MPGRAGHVRPRTHGASFHRALLGPADGLIAEAADHVFLSFLPNRGGKQFFQRLAEGRLLAWSKGIDIARQDPAAPLEQPDHLLPTLGSQRQAADAAVCNPLLSHQSLLFQQGDGPDHCRLREVELPGDPLDSDVILDVDHEQRGGCRAGHAQLLLHGLANLIRKRQCQRSEQVAKSALSGICHGEHPD